MRGAVLCLLSILALCGITCETAAANAPGDIYDHINEEYLPANRIWMEVGFFSISEEWARVETTYLNFTDPVVFLGLPNLQVASSVALRVNNTHLDYIGNGLKRFSFDARSYGVQDEFCNLTYYTPGELTVASSFVGWLVVERGMFNVSHHAFIVSADTINRTNSNDDSDPRNQFKSFAPLGACGGKNCRLNNAAAYLSIAQLQTTRFDRFLLLRGISRGRRFVVYILTPHDSAQEANYYIPDPGEVYAWILFEAGLAVTCTENLVMETKLYNVNFQAISVSFANMFSFPPFLFGMINTLNGRDSLALRAVEVTETSADFITQEDKCLDQETTHVGTEETSVLIIGQAGVGMTRCGAAYDLSPPTIVPTATPTMMPSGEPTGVPTTAPTTIPSGAPTKYPTGEPTSRPTALPTSQPTCFPTVIPSARPTRSPTGCPTSLPSADPTASPSVHPSTPPSGIPTGHPTAFPTAFPTALPTGHPTSSPTGTPTPVPTPTPTGPPSGRPSVEPTGNPSWVPSGNPSSQPSSGLFIADSALSADGFTVTVKFNAATDKAPVGRKSFPCDEIVEFSLASASLCSWSSSHVLKASLYSNTAYVSDDYVSATDLGSVNVLSGRVRGACPAKITDCAMMPVAEASRVAKISLPGNPLAPSPALSSSSRYASCDTLVLDPSGSTGRAGLTWKEVCWEGSGTGNVAPLLAFLNANYTEHTDSRIFVPSDLANAAGNFTVTLILTNFFDLTRNASATVLADDGKIRPAVSIVGPQNVRVTRDQALRLFVKASVPACLGVGLPLLSYGWRVWNLETNEEYRFQSTSKDPRRFHLPKYSLNSSIVYVAEVVSIVDDPRVVSSSYSVTITVDALYGTKARIRGGSIRTASSLEPFTLDASRSYHLDQPDAPLLYRWVCVDVTPGRGSSCGVSLQDSAQVSVSVSESSIAERTFIFSVYVSSGVDTGVSIATAEVEVKPDVVPLISMGAVADKLDPLSYVKMNCTIDTPYAVLASWSSSEINSTRLQAYSAASLFRTFDPGVHLFTLKLDVGLIDPGKVYTFEVSVYSGSDVSIISSSESVSRSQVVVIGNTPPYRGVLEMIPTEGVALNTTFFLETKSWIADADNYPLQYRMSYYTTDSSARLSLLASGVVPYAEAVLRAGDSNFDFAVTCVAEAVDIFGSAGEVSRVVSVYPSGDSLSSDSADASFEAAGNSTDYDRVDQLLAGYASLFSMRNCSLAPNCTDLHREPCSEHPQTCGRCLAGYIGLDAPSNFRCVLTSDVGSQVLNGECSRDADCTSYQCADRLCVSEVLVECPGSCSGHGQCVALNSNRDILPSCSVFDPFCTVECLCDDGFYGMYCDYEVESYESAQRWQKLLCSEFSKLSNTSDVSPEASISRGSIMSLLLQDLSLLTAEAFGQCASVIVRTISDDPVLSSDEVPFQYWLGVLSSAVAATDSEVSLNVRELLFQTVLALSTAAHAHLATGTSIDHASDHIRVISRVSYPKESEEDGEYFVIPRTEYESAAGLFFGTVDVGEVSPTDSSEVGYMVILYLNIPAGVLGNATTISFETVYYAEGDEDGTGRRRLQSSTVDRNVTVSLQNIVEFEGGEPSLVDEVLVDCVYNLVDGEPSSYSVAVECGGLTRDVVCWGNGTYSAVLYCYSEFEQPQCDNWGSDGVLGGQNCTVLEYSKWNTTCRCTESNIALSGADISSSDSIVRRNYGVTVELVGESFASRFNTFNSFSGSTVRRNIVIFSVILGLVSCFVVFGAIILRADFKHIEYAAIREKYVDSSWKRARNFKTLLRSALPAQFSSLPWYLRYKALLLEQHEWLALLFSSRSDYSQHNNFVSLLWVHAFGKLINFFFVGTVLAILYFADDDTCDGFTSRGDCLKPVGINFRDSLCEWHSDTHTCRYAEIDASFAVAVSIAVAINILVTPLDAMLRFLLQMTRRLLTTEEEKVLASLAGRKERSLESYRAGELSKVQTTQSKLMCAVRLYRMRQSIDEPVTVYSEMDNFLDLQRRSRARLLSSTGSFYAMQAPESVAVHEFSNSMNREALRWKFVVQESMYDVPVHVTQRQQWEESLFNSEMWRSSHVYWLLYNVRLAKCRAENSLLAMNSLPDDDTRDEFLLRLFFVEAMVGYRRRVASLFFMDRNMFGYRTGIRSSRRFQLGCTLFIALYLIFFCLYIFLFGVTIGPSATNLWLVCICFAYLQNVLLIEPVLIYVYGITIAGLIYKDVTALASRIRLHGKKILTRHRGTSFNPSAHYIHHINAACRVARNVPHLVVSRLLISFNDWDLPVNFAPRYHQTGGLASCLRAVLFVQALCALAFLYLLPTAVQEALLEILLSLVVGFFFVSLSASHESNAIFLAVPLAIIVLSFFVLLWYLRNRNGNTVKILRFNSGEYDSFSNKDSVVSRSGSGISDSTMKSGPEELYGIL